MEKAGSKSQIKDGGAIKGAYVSPAGRSMPEGGHGRSAKLKTLVEEFPMSIVDSSPGANDVVMELKPLPI